MNGVLEKFSMSMPAVDVSVTDVVQIVILYLVFYAILKAARGSRFGQVLTGAGILFGVLIACTYILHFDVLSRMVRGLLFYLALSSVVIFQPEIRRILATLGAILFQGKEHVAGGRAHASPEQMAECIFRLAERRIGALFAFERGISLRGYDSTGVAMDAVISPELTISIFTEPLPLHDGGVVVRNGRFASAHCLFPVSRRADLSGSGMRHRAAVGLSEETDALVVAVSEESGRISVAHNGRLVRYPAELDEASRAAVIRWMRKAMPQQKSAMDLAGEWLRRRVAKFRKGAAK